MVGLKANRIGVLTFRLTANRVVPAEVRVPKGRYLIQVSNGVWGGPISVDLNRTTAAAAIAVAGTAAAIDRVGSLQFAAGRGRNQFEVELAPGTHQLRIEPRPAQWTAQITVEP